MAARLRKHLIAQHTTLPARRTGVFAVGALVGWARKLLADGTLTFDAGDDDFCCHQDSVARDALLALVAFFTASRASDLMRMTIGRTVFSSNGASVTIVLLGNKTDVSRAGLRKVLFAAEPHEPLCVVRLLAVWHGLVRRCAARARARDLDLVPLFPSSERSADPHRLSESSDSSAISRALGRALKAIQVFAPGYFPEVGPDMRLRAHSFRASGADFIKSTYGEEAAIAMGGWGAARVMRAHYVSLAHVPHSMIPAVLSTTPAEPPCVFAPARGATPSPVHGRGSGPPPPGPLRRAVGALLFDPVRPRLLSLIAPFALYVVLSAGRFARSSPVPGIDIGWLG